MSLSWSFFPLHPETPPEGKPLSELFKGREAQLAGFKERIQEIAAAEGLPYGDRNMTYNSRLAQELGSWADAGGQGDALHDLLYRAYFVENMNISDLEVLVALAEQAGLDPDEARLVLSERRFSANVDADWQRARGMGISGVPTFASADLVVVGCQSYEILLRFVNHLRKLKAASAS